MQGQQITLPPMGRITKILLITFVALFFLGSILQKTAGLPIGMYFGLNLDMFAKGFIYQIFTYPFFHTGLMDILFGGLIFWFLGGEFEQQWGDRRYIFFLAFTALGGALIHLTHSLFLGSDTLVGISTVGSGMCLAYAYLFPDRQFTFMFLFPMKAKWFCALLIGINIYQGFLAGSGVAITHLGAMGASYLAMFLMTKPGIKAFLSGESAPMQRKVSKNSHLKLVDEKDKDDKNDSPKYWQ